MMWGGGGAPGEEDSDIAIETLRHLHLENAAHQYASYKSGSKKFLKANTANSRFYAKAGKATVPVHNYPQLDDGLDDNDEVNDTIVFQNKRDQLHQHSRLVDTFYDSFSDQTTSILCPQSHVILATGGNDHAFFTPKGNEFHSQPPCSDDIPSSSSQAVDKERLRLHLVVAADQIRVLNSDGKPVPIPAHSTTFSSSQEE